MLDKGKSVGIVHDYMVGMVKGVGLHVIVINCTLGL